MRPDPDLVFFISIVLLTTVFMLLLRVIIYPQVITKYKRLWKYIVVGYKQLPEEERFSLGVVVAFAFVYGMLLLNL